MNRGEFLASAEDKINGERDEVYEIGRAHV